MKNVYYKKSHKKSNSFESASLLRDHQNCIVNILLYPAKSCEKDEFHRLYFYALKI